MTAMNQRSQALENDLISATDLVPNAAHDLGPDPGEGVGVWKARWPAVANRFLSRGKHLIGSLTSSGRTSPKLLSISERLDIGPKKSLLIVACGERRFLVASSAETIAAMLEIGSTGNGLRDRIPVVVPVRWSEL